MNLSLNNIIERNQSIYSTIFEAILLCAHMGDYAGKYHLLTMKMEQGWD